MSLHVTFRILKEVLKGQKGVYVPEKYKININILDVPLSLQKIKCVLKSWVSCKMKEWKLLKHNQVIKSSLKTTSGD